VVERAQSDETAWILEAETNQARTRHLRWPKLCGWSRIVLGDDRLEDAVSWLRYGRWFSGAREPFSPVRKVQVSSLDGIVSQIPSLVSRVMITTVLIPTRLRSAARFRVRESASSSVV
jgi:hypothetical protein